MGFSNELPPAYVWQDGPDHQHTLLLRDCPIVTVGPLGAGWRIQVVLKGDGIPPSEYTVRSLERGKAWAQRWVKQRERLVAKACGLPVKPLPAVSSSRGRPRNAA